MVLSNAQHRCPWHEIISPKMHNASDVIRKIMNSLKDLPDTASQQLFSVFFSDIMSTEAVLTYALSSIRDKKGGIRRYTGDNGSGLVDSVMKDFPKDHVFLNFENDPTKIDQGMTLRKMIILMYYIVYSYEFSKEFSIMNYNSDIFEELGFIEFMDELNSILSSCFLHPLYPANQFDWLVLRCIRQFEIGEDFAEIDYENDDPIALFNKVLAYSFGDDPTEDN